MTLYELNGHEELAKGSRRLGAEHGAQRPASSRTFTQKSGVPSWKTIPAAAGVRYPTGIAETGGCRSPVRRSGPDRADLPIRHLRRIALCCLTSLNKLFSWSDGIWPWPGGA